jgi:hypothetical protein
MFEENGEVAVLGDSIAEEQGEVRTGEPRIAATPGKGQPKTVSLPPRKRVSGPSFASWRERARLD